MVKCCRTSPKDARRATPPARRTPTRSRPAADTELAVLVGGCRRRCEHRLVVCPTQQPHTVPPTRKTLTGHRGTSAHPADPAGCRNSLDAHFARRGHAHGHHRRVARCNRARHVTRSSEPHAGLLNPVASLVREGSLTGTPPTTRARPMTRRVRSWPRTSRSGPPRPSPTRWCR